MHSWQSPASTPQEGACMTAPVSALLMGECEQGRGAG